MSTSKAPSPLLTTVEVAALLSVHPKHVYRLMRRGLPARRVGSTWRFERQEVLAWARLGPGGAPEVEAPVAAPVGAAPGLVAANGDLAVEILLRMVDEQGISLGLLKADRGGALVRLEQGRVLLAGCHGAGFPAFAGDVRLARIHLVTREVGLCARGPVPATSWPWGRVSAFGRPGGADMDTLNQLMQGFVTAGTPVNLLWALLGCTIGTAVGVLPGIGPATAVAMLLPLTLKVEPTASMIFFAGIYYGAMYGGSTTSILLNTPGETGSMVTALEGFKMAKSGRAGAALATAAIGSFVAGTIATVLVTLFAPLVATHAVKLGPPEYFLLMVLAFCTVSA